MAALGLRRGVQELRLRALVFRVSGALVGSRGPGGAQDSHSSVRSFWNSCG